MTIDLGDINGDGVIDVLFSTARENIVAWMEGQRGRLPFQLAQPIGDTDDSAIALLADVDGDADLDVITTNFVYQDRENRFWHLSWNENTDGLGTFGPSIRIDGGRWDDRFGSISKLIIADVDGDNDEDVVVAKHRALTWYENLGGEFAKEQVVSDVAVSTVSVASADIDGDGDLDLLTTSATGFIFDQDTPGHFAWYENQNGGGFERHFVYEADLSSVVAADLDGDGDLDLAVSRLASPAVDVLLNTDGLGSFNMTETVTFQGRGTAVVSAADIDGDGDQDVVARSSEDEGVIWFENDGQAQFGDSQVISDGFDGIGRSGWGFQSLIPLDYDDDGDIELFSGSPKRTSIFLYDRGDAFVTGDVNGDGRFDSSDLVLVAQAGRYGDTSATDLAYEEGDFNGDGKFDSRDLVFAFQTGAFTA